MNGNYVDSEYYINNLINNVCQNNKIEFDSDIDYMIYYINTNNIWAIKLILEFVQDGIEAKNNLPDRDYNNLGIILEAMQNSKNEQYSNKINSIQNNEKYIKIMGKYKENKNKAKDQIAENKNSIISETNNIINKIANTSDTNRVFVHLYGDFCKQLHSLYSYVKDFAYKDREELLGDTIKQIWNQNNQSTIQKLINALESDIKTCQNNKDINQFKSFLNFLNNDQFKNSTQFSQFNQIRQYYTSNY